MTLLNILETFHRDETGAVTVDWVVLTAAIVGLGFIILGTASQGILAAAVNVSADTVAKQVAATNSNN